MEPPKETDLKLAFRALVFAGALSLALNAAAAQPTDAGYKPQLGQKGKDVVWIPSPDDMVEKMLDLAKVTPQDFVVDLGSGDGRNVIAAARRGARALGVEWNADLVELSKRSAVKAGVGDRAMFVQGDMFAADISNATALILFLIPANLWKLAPKFLDLKPGTRIVSNTYEIGLGWEPDETDRTAQCLTWCVAYLYIVPARVTGTWRTPDGQLELDQYYQKVSGTYELAGIRLPVEDGTLRGNQIRFMVNGIQYTGEIAGDTIKGVAKGRASAEWSARRAN